MKSLYLPFFLGFTTLASADVVVVGKNGKMSYLYQNEGKVWLRECPKNASVKKLSDCHASVEHSLGTVAEARLALHHMGANFEWRETAAENITRLQKEILAMEQRHKSFGTKDAQGKLVPIEKDPTTDASYLEKKKNLKEFKQAESQAELLLLKISLGHNIVHASGTSPLSVLTDKFSSFDFSKVVTMYWGNQGFLGVCAILENPFAPWMEFVRMNDKKEFKMLVKPNLLPAVYGNEAVPPSSIPACQGLVTVGECLNAKAREFCTDERAVSVTSTLNADDSNRHDQKKEFPNSSQPKGKATKTSKQ